MAPAAPAFTDRQGQYLAFILDYAQINRRSPAGYDLPDYSVGTPDGAYLGESWPHTAYARAGRRHGAMRRSRALPVLGQPQLVKSLCSGNQSLKTVSSTQQNGPRSLPGRLPQAPWAVSGRKAEAHLPLGLT